VAAILIALLLALPNNSEESLPSMLARVNALSAQKQFAEAEGIAQDAVRCFPHSRDARLLLANVLLWEGKYATARSQFRQLVASSPRDVNARLGVAQSEYWSGDYRKAAREFRKILQLQPSRSDARGALTEIEEASRPGFRVEAEALSDDQPYHAAGGTATLYMFSDPLTKWELDFAQTHRSSRRAVADTPLLRVAAETAFVPVTIRAAMTRIRFPEARREWLPMMSIERKVAATTLNLTAQREELLRTASALRNHPTAETLSLRWSNNSFGIHAQHLQYFDHNHGDGIDAFVLRAIARIAIGASAAYRDTAESRFTSGMYDPYYTPQKLREARLIASSTLKRGAVTIGWHVDGGFGHEQVVGAFHPWRASANVAVPLPHAAVLSIASERSATAFYTANEIRASVAGRF
jgi:tetratricopeptide (TPR) repeat protein